MTANITILIYGVTNKGDILSMAVSYTRLNPTLDYSKIEYKKGK